MTFAKNNARANVTHWLTPSLLIGLALGLASYSMDFVMAWFGTSSSETILNDVVVGLLGFLAVFFYLSACHRKEIFANAKERIVLMKELNLRIRRELVVLANSVLSEDRCDWLQGIDEATERIDLILLDLAAEVLSDSVKRSDCPTYGGSSRTSTSSASS